MGIVDRHLWVSFMDTLCITYICSNIRNIFFWIGLLCHFFAPRVRVIVPSIPKDSFHVQYSKTNTYTQLPRPVLKNTNKNTTQSRLKNTYTQLPCPVLQNTQTGLKFEYGEVFCHVTILQRGTEATPGIHFSRVWKSCCYVTNMQRKRVYAPPQKLATQRKFCSSALRKYHIFV